MADGPVLDLAPRLADAPILRIAGTRAHYTASTKHGMATQWQRFAPRMDAVPGRVGRVGWAVVSATSGDGVDYLAGVEVADVTRLPADLVHVVIPAQRYAVFAHDRDVSRIGEAMHAIEQWLRRSTHARVGGGPADLLERYGEGFDPQTGTGDIELWVPVVR